MRFPRLVSFGLALLLTPPPSSAQQSPPPQRDPQGLAVLKQAIAAAGGSNALGSVQDFTASGSITYFWADQQVEGSVMLRGRGTNEFRLDANLPQGTRSWPVSKGEGSLLEATGARSSIPFSNSWNLGSLSAPHLGMLAALSDTSMSVVLVGQTAVANKQVYDVRLQKSFTLTEDLTGELSRWTSKDYLIDSENFMLMATQDVENSNDAPWQSFKHQVLFSDYRAVNGVILPFLIIETINGQQTWKVQITSITLNTGLTDSAFRF